MATILHLKSWLEKLAKGVISRAELTRLIHVCRSIAESHLTQQRASLVHICSLHGLTLSDLAYDCIAQLFARDEDENFYQLENFAASLPAGLEQTPESELFLAFKAFVLKAVKARLAKIYAESDPVGARIHRNIKACIKTCPALKLTEDFRGYVLQPANRAALEHLNPFPNAEIEKALFARIRGPTHIPELLEVLTAIITEQQKYRRSLPLLDVVQIFKKFYAQFAETITIEEGPPQVNQVDELDLQIIQKEVRRAVQEKIVSTYFMKGKITQPEAETLSRVMSEVVADWCRGATGETSLYQYLGRCMTLSKTEYETQWRTKLEYLTRIAREHLAVCLTENI